MPQITEITKQKRNKARYNIFLDGEYAGSLNDESLVLNNIKPGVDISSQDFKAIIQHDNEKYAFNLAIKYISLKRRTVAETKKYLVGKEIDAAITETALEKVLSYGYLNDLEYANEFVSYYINAGKFGKTTVAYKLKTKGVDQETIESAMVKFSADTEEAIARNHYAKLREKYRDLSPYERKAKINRALTSKGFSFDIISAVVSLEDDE